MTSAFSWQSSVSLSPLFLYSKAKFAGYSRYLQLLTFTFQSPIMKKTSFFWVLVLEGLVGLHRTVQLQLFQCY